MSRAPQRGGLTRRAAAAVLAGLVLMPGAVRAEGPDDWRDEFPDTDFSRTSVDYGEITFDGPRRDTIPPIVDPRFIAVAEAGDIGPLEPVLSIGIDGDFRAYPVQILLWHEIVNDVVGGVPVLISYCPLCNSGVVFDRRVDGRILDFGNTGRIRHFDMVMYDRQTESWWQQFRGEAIMGALLGARLKALPARLESLERFEERAPEGRVLVPPDAGARPYGATPYAGMDGASVPPGRFPYPLPDGVAPLSRVVVVGDQAWTLDAVRAMGRITSGDLVIDWTAGQNSIHDKRVIAFGRDVGNVTVRRRTAAGLIDVPYDVSFAFSAFTPDGRLYHR